MTKFQIISIEGNIGSGKSTLLGQLQSHYHNNPLIHFVDEPVHEWNNIKDKNGHTMLELFYNNQEKYAFSFQMMAYISRIHKMIEIIDKINSLNSNETHTIITERSVFTDKHVFAKMLYEDNKIEDVNYQIYNQWFDHFSKHTIDKIIYVNTTPDICLNRIKSRHRNGETNIPLEYLQTCHEKHQEMLEIMQANRLTIEGNNTATPPVMQLWIESMSSFIETYITYI